MKKLVVFCLVAIVFAAGTRLLAFPQSLMISGVSLGATASLAAAPTSIAPSSSSTLTWSSTHAASCISPGALGDTAIPSFTGSTSGSVSTGALTSTTTYSIQCGSATAAAAVAVTGGGTVACDFGNTPGPGPTGVAATDVTTAGFTRCAYNTDFTGAWGANLNNWLGGQNACGTGNLWLNNIADGQASPCSDIRIVTDGSNGQVLDLTYTAADIAANQSAVNLGTGFIGGPGHLFPTGMYIEFKKRWATNAYNMCQTVTPLQGCDLQGTFKSVPNGFGCGPFVEWDFDEIFMYNFSSGNDIENRGAIGPRVSCSPVAPFFPITGNNLLEWCSRTESSSPKAPDCLATVHVEVMHTYGELITTDGNTMGVCYYFDVVPGTYLKLGCFNYTAGSMPSVPTIYQARELLITQIGAGLDSSTGHPPAGLSPPGDTFIEYYRVFSCPNWNVGGTNATSTEYCAGTPVVN